MPQIKKSVIFIGVLFVLALMGCLAFLALHKKAPAQPKTETPPPAQITSTYGIKMETGCYEKFQDFLKSHGADYSKCLNGYDFNEKFCGGFDPNTQAFSNSNVLVILDASGSMAEKISDGAKIEVAKKTVSDFLGKMPAGVNTGLIVYGDKGSNSAADKDISCNGIDEIIKLGQNDYAKIISATNSFEPRGWTPIARSIDFAKNIFEEKGQGDTDYLVLLSDGIESCGGDPLMAVENLKVEQRNVKLLVIGLGGDDKTNSFLKKIADVAEGDYVPADNFASVAKAFNSRLLLIKKDCLNSTLYKISYKYSQNNSANQACWQAANKKEIKDMNNFLANDDGKCLDDMAQAQKNRSDGFWYKEQDLEKTSAEKFKQVQADFDAQLKALEK